MQMNASSFSRRRALGSLAVLCAVVASVTLTACKPRKLNEDMLREMTDAGLRATVNRNADALCAQIAEDAEIRIVVFKFSGSDIRTFGKAQWCDYLRESFAKNAPGLTVSVNANIESITIAPGGKTGEMVATMTEEVGYGGRTLVKVTSKQSATVALRDGRALYVKLSARYST